MSQLEAGRELDALIAEKVFGWLWMGVSDARWFGPPSEAFGSESRGKYRIGRPGFPFWLDDPDTAEDEDEKSGIVPKYSIDISLAFEIVEKMHRKGWFFEIENGNDGSYHAVFWRKYNRVDRVGRRAATAPLAICLSALSNLGLSHD